MLRVVVAVTLAVALLGVAMPTVETARVEHADARVAAEVDELIATATLLAERNDPPPAGIRGARRTVALYLPGPSWSTERLESLVVPGPADSAPRGTIRWQVAGGHESTRYAPVPLVGPKDGFVVQSGGRQEVVLELVSRDGRQIVLVRHGI
jgi:hypothetical protein